MLTEVNGDCTLTQFKTFVDRLKTQSTNWKTVLDADTASAASASDDTKKKAYEDREAADKAS